MSGVNDFYIQDRFLAGFELRTESDDTLKLILTDDYAGHTWRQEFFFDEKTENKLLGFLLRRAHVKDAGRA